MEERIYEAFAGHERPTVIGKRLHPGEAAPDFSLDYLDLADQDVRTVGLADSAGMVRLLNVITSLNRPLCQHVTRWWETLCGDLPSQACIFTISVDSPQMQARWQASEGVLHQLFSASRGEQFGLNYGVWLKEWQQLARAIFVVDRRNYIVYVEYVADQSRGRIMMRLWERSIKSAGNDGRDEEGYLTRRRHSSKKEVFPRWMHKGSEKYGVGFC